MAGRLQDQVAVVTGAGRGIGEAIAQKLAEEGALIAVLDVQEKEAQAAAERLGSGNLGLACDVADSALMAAAARAVQAHFGRVDILVNNAGINRDARYADITDEMWGAVLGVNLKGAFNGIRAFGPGMAERGSGRIISVASRAALGNFGQANYSASKAGIIGLTRTIALELGPRGVTVNAVAPGWIDTPMTRGVPAHVAEKVVKAIPLRRAGQPRDVANLVCFLASDEAAYITGQALFVCGGRSIGAVGA